MMTEMDILKSFGSKVAEYCIDIGKEKIIEANRNRKANGQSMETRIYQVIVDALNECPYNKYKKKEQVYNAAESILKQFKRGRDDYKENVSAGLRMIVLQVTDDICEEFLKLLCDEMCKEENRDLAIGYIIHQGEQIIEQQQKMDRHVQEEFAESHQNEKEILEEVNGVKYLIKEMNGEKGCKTENKRPIVNRANEYAKKWNENVFLNNFNKRDKNAGVNIKLKDIYLEDLLPHYKWKPDGKEENDKELKDENREDLKELLSEYIVDNDEKKILLILGQPGIGKSTLITWIMANLVEKREQVLVYQFATDLNSIDWQKENVLNDIFSFIGLRYANLENKTLILDGFDEIHTDSDRERILNKLNQELKRLNTLESFSLIITCRENYIYNSQNMKCDYIVLQAWDETQIESFCRAYWRQCKKAILESKIQKIQENKEIFGIPLILYMILALDITIEKSSSIVDVYDQIFSLEKGVIYDRCYDTEHRVNEPETKKYIHQTSQRIAFWIFENNNIKAFIYQKEFKEICDIVMLDEKNKNGHIQSDTLIGSYFKIKHCEGELANEISFVHRSIYEYFVVVYIFESIHNLKLKEEVAGKLGDLLKKGILSQKMLEFIKYKFSNISEYNLADVTKEIFNIMLRDGMTYHMKKQYKNIIERELNIFSNMSEVVGMWNPIIGELDDRIVNYLQYRDRNGMYIKSLNLRGIRCCCALLMRIELEGAFLERADLRESFLIGTNLRGANLAKANLASVDLSGADLEGANLEGTILKDANLTRVSLANAYLEGANLTRANLSGADLIGADLSRVNLSEANLTRANLAWADLSEAKLFDVILEGVELYKTIFDEKQICAMIGRYDIRNCRVYLFETKKIVNLLEYLPHY